jgi:hypothetical protein
MLVDSRRRGGRQETTCFQIRHSFYCSTVWGQIRHSFYCSTVWGHAGRQEELSVVPIVNDDATAEAASDYVGCIDSINCMQE